MGEGIEVGCVLKRVFAVSITGEFEASLRLAPALHKNFLPINNLSTGKTQKAYFLHHIFRITVSAIYLAL